MAKALLGYVGSDPRLLDENQRLRRRVEDLQSLVKRLQADNDELVSRVHDVEPLLVPDHLDDRAAAPA
ncbi:MAG: hypothetical protein M3423_08140 [Actinomycetota bacterium]|nr:hypothetical protein [Nocardioidaceae bacterium]MDQ3481281.1 hypothetical protein [Actinomycetota bacterium]